MIDATISIDNFSPIRFLNRCGSFTLPMSSDRGACVQASAISTREDSVRLPMAEALFT